MEPNFMQKEAVARRLLLTTIVIIVLLLGGCGISCFSEPDMWIRIPPPGSSPGDPDYHYAFEPDEYTATVNTSVVLRIHNPDKVPYIFIIDELNVKKELYPGAITAVRFTARQTGEYEFYIEGLRERGLVGTLIVKGSEP